MDEKIRIKLLNTVTDYDRQQSKRSHYNFYAIGHYLGAVQRVVQHVDNGADLRTAVLNCFLGRLCDRVLKSVGLEKMTIEEAKYGAFEKLTDID